MPEDPAYAGRTPSADFERSNGLTGISQRYKLPPQYAKLTPVRADEWVRELLNAGTGSDPWKKRLALLKLNELNDTITKLNPELQGVARRPDDLHAEYDVLAGVNSRYHPRDIGYYLEFRQATSSSTSSEARMAQFHLTVQLEKRMKTVGEKIMSRNNGVFHPPAAGWHYSPATMDLIEQQIETPRPRPKRSPGSTGPR